MLTQQRLKEALDYDPETGIFTRRHVKIKNGMSTLSGRKAGYINPIGYVVFSVDGVNYLAHRLAWMYVTGEWPPQHTDHINGIRHDNRWCNLRVATPTQNYANAPRKSSNTSGFKGVSLHGKKWRARIRWNGKYLSIGSFDTKEEAQMAYAEAAQRYYGEFARFE